MPCRHVVFLAAAATLLLSGHGLAQGQGAAVFSADTELVVLHVSVTDRRGAYVGGLPPEAFSVFEDGRAQTISLVTDADTPVTVGLLIDGSASMYPHRRLAIAAATAFVEVSDPRDEVFALAFNEHVRSVLPPNAPFTSDGAVLGAALERSVAARGRTALYDAIANGLDYLARGVSERKVLVVLSDGGDNASRFTREEAVHAAQRSNAVIYTIGLVEERQSDANPALLRELARASGGDSFRPRRPRDIAAAFDRIARDIRNVYTVGYIPAASVRDGSFRSVRVEARGPSGRALDVRTRAGYWAP